MNNLHLAILDKVGVPVEEFGDATGVLPVEPLAGRVTGLEDINMR